jgi:hypothetical protein
MNFKKHNQDLVILQREAKRARYGQTPGWMHIDWKLTDAGGNMIFLRQVALPPTCSARRTDIKIETPPNCYEPIGGGRLVFYRNIWISPEIQLFDRRHRAWVPMPRLHGRDSDGFAYLCIHPDSVTPEKNILDFIRVLDLFLLNPGYKASTGEQS